MNMTDREYVTYIVKHLSRALASNVSPEYSNGYLQASVVSAVMDLPPAMRDFHIRCLKSALENEDEIARNGVAA
jgi:hypothetical protein